MEIAARDAQIEQLLPALMRSRMSPRAMQQIAKREMNVKLRLQFSDRDVVHEKTVQSLRRMKRSLSDLAEVLEVRCVLSAFAEALHLSGVRTMDEILRNPGEIFNLTQAIAGIDVIGVIKRHPEVFGPAVARKPTTVETQLPPALLEKSVGAARSLLAIVNERVIELISEAAKTTAAASFGDRCRRAYDRLVAFVGRNAPESDTRLITAGHAYRDGRLSIDEVSAVLQLRRTDTVALLEAYGFARPQAKVVLSPASRAEIIARIQAERAARHGQPDPRKALILREVIATQRIERIDARAWIPPIEE